MLAVSPMVQETVQQLNAMTVVSSHVLELFRLLLVVLFERVEPFWLHPVAGHLIQYFNFIKGRDEIVTGRSLNFQRYIRVILYVLSKPDGREMTPAQLLNDQIAIDEHLSAKWTKMKG